MTLRQNNSAKVELAAIVTQCFQGLALWGKEPESLPGTIRLFEMVLGEYEPDKIRDAFAFYLKNNRDFPMPADIARIIQRGNKPDFDKQFYGEILKKPGCDRTPDEWQYKREYEQLQMRGV